MRTPFGKTVSVNSPYAVYKNEQAGWEWRVLKTYQHPDNESKNEYSRWFVAAKSPYTHGSWEMGDTYTKEVTDYGTLAESTETWSNLYGSK